MSTIETRSSKPAPVVPTLSARHRVLFIQTAFFGDAILASAALMAWRKAFPQAEIEFVVRKGAKTLFSEHPAVDRVWEFDKTGAVWLRYARIVGLVRELRKASNRSFDVVVNMNRFPSAGWIAALSGGKFRVGFDPQPMRKWQHLSLPHVMESGVHEIDRNFSLIAPFLNGSPLEEPALFAATEDRKWAEKHGAAGCIVLAPASQWPTKQWPEEKWTELVRAAEARWPEHPIVLMGGLSDQPLLKRIAGDGRASVVSPETTFGRSLALIEGSAAVVSNDSAPLHLASATNRPTVALYCSTVSDFGFGPRADRHEIVEFAEHLACRPCGLHGHRICPETHFKCGSYGMEKVLTALEDVLQS